MGKRRRIDQGNFKTAAIGPRHEYSFVKRLEAANLLRRSRNEMDERVVNVYLTITGRNIQSEVAEMQKAVACQTGLGESEFIELRSTLHRLVETLNQNQPDAEEDNACALPS